ncbi:MAG TPA: phosphotransferase [Mycobacteriales bacterium]|nr:phosphotransferase [Mycobacteriales bacterium]
MTPEWTAEHVVDASSAAELIGAQFPDLRGAAVRPLATGWDNTVHVVGETWVFRFPRREPALTCFDREVAALPLLAPMLPLAMPVPERIGVPQGDYPWPFWGARLLPGRELADAHLPDDRRERAAVATGEFLSALHRTALPEHVLAHVPVDPMRRGDAAYRAGLAAERLDRLAEAGTWTHDADVASLLDLAAGLAAPAGPVVLSHGDLHARHLLVDEAGAAAGVIDWGDLCRADAAVDLSIAYGAFAGRSRAALLSAYGPMTPEQDVRARVLALFLCAALAEYAAAEARPELLAEVLRGLRRAVSD